jgi:hypothetical protein
VVKAGILCASIATILIWGCCLPRRCCCRQLPKVLIWSGPQPHALLETFMAPVVFRMTWISCLFSSGSGCPRSCLTLTLLLFFLPGAP